MEKLGDLSKKFPEAGKYVPLGEAYVVEGWGIANTKKGAVQTLTLVRISDKLQFSVFADQLRMDGDKLFVSEYQLLKQIKRAEDFARGVSSK